MCREGLTHSLDGATICLSAPRARGRPDAEKGRRVATIINIWDKLTAADIHIVQTRCVRVRNRHASCRACVDACTTGCIGYADNELIISPEKCIGCATCSTACPTDALLPKSLPDVELHQACIAAGQANGGRVVVACRQLLDAADGLYDPAKAVGVTCLGRVDETLIVHLATVGASSLTLVQGPCETCGYARGSDVAHRVVASAATVLDAWNAPFPVRITPKLPASTRLAADIGYDVSKRAFFAAAGEEVRTLARTAAETTLEDTFALREEEPSRFVHVDERGTLPHAVSARRELMMRCLDALAERGNAVAAESTPQDMMIATRLWNQVIIDVDACNTCRMCATFCPTGANFKFSTKSGGVGVKHRVRQCVNCHLCEDICPTKALSYSAEVFARDVAEGVVERFPMHAQDARYGAKDAVLSTVKPLFKSDNLHVSEYGHS